MRAVQVGLSGRQRVGVLVIAMSVVGLIVNALLTHRGEVPSAEAIDQRTSGVSTPGARTPVSAGAPVVPGAPGAPLFLPNTGNQHAYAEAVTSLLFGMDQRVYTGADYMRLLVAARSPEALRLIPEITDDAFLEALSERIPDEYMWQRMRDSGQYADFEVTRVWEPEYIAAKRASGELLDGVVGLNVAGIQTIYYIDENDEPAQRERAQSVSLLVACAPVQTECGLIAVSTGVVE